MELGEQSELLNERDPEDWDWMDAYYFKFAPFNLTPGWECFLDTPYVRIKRWEEEINDRNSPNSDCYLSLVEQSMFKVALAMTPKS